MSIRTTIQGLLLPALGAALLASPARADEVRTFEVDLSEEQSGPPPTARVTAGDEAEITVVSPDTVVVHLHGYDHAAKLTEDEPQVLRFTATVPGRFPLEIHHISDGSHDSDDDHDSHASHGDRPVLYLEVLPQ